MLHFKGLDVMRVTYTLSSGVYRLVIENQEKRPPTKTQKLLQIENEPKALNLAPPIKRGQIVITNPYGVTTFISLD